ncbi:recombinase family protein [Ruegeria sp.]|uniref:recombinase family protein n=1 Tax=Ruegeria sp. TaxID=1879320 RepID=UPI003B004156
MLIGYARVSTEDQNIDLQTAALRECGCKNIYSDIGISGAKMNRPGLETAINSAERGDIIVVWRLDRLGRSLCGLVEVVMTLLDRNIGFRSLTEAIDTVSSTGKLCFHMMAALAEFERNLISERTKAGLAAARSRGKQLGRPRKITEERLELAYRDLLLTEKPLTTICSEYDFSERTFRRFIESKNGYTTRPKTCSVLDLPPETSLVVM